MEVEGHLGRMSIRSFDKHLQSTNDALDVFVDPGDRSAQPGRVSCLCENYMRMERNKLQYKNQMITYSIHVNIYMTLPILSCGARRTFL